MSATIVFGFFVLANGKHVKTFRARVVFPVMLHVYSPFNDAILADNTVTFISTKIAILANIPSEPTLLEGVYIVPVPGNANVDDYECHVPDFPYPVVIGLGLVTSQLKTLLDGTSKAFDIISTDYV
ncbi:hypothetical protein EDD17DRAFT_1465017 [Pisolithus thermaeus]|nr:hypothetical protein EV401DRAFT_1881279 [Pisolithus croceorrhizus]KAI6169038.1 hypothetical protein EDD17DRAFT_1465017 [Pisolithus thermaeus]